MSPLFKSARRLTAMALLLTAGCSPYGKIVPVKGTVTVDGKPASYGMVVFAPDKDNKATVFPQGAIDGSGNFQMTTADLPGVPVGSYKVFLQDNRQEDKRTKLVSAAWRPIYGSANTSPW